jgi:hypothetical protein
MPSLAYWAWKIAWKLRQGCLLLKRTDAPTAVGKLAAYQCYSSADHMRRYTRHRRYRRIGCKLQAGARS